MIKSGIMPDGTRGSTLPTIVIHLAVAAGIILAIWVLSQVVLVISFAVLLACILRGVTEFMAAHTSIRSPFALAFVVLSTILAAVGGNWWVGPRLTGEWHDLVQRITSIWFGVPVPFARGTLAGLLTFIPYFGAILAAIPAILLAFTIGWSTAAWTLCLYTLSDYIEDCLIDPIVQRRLVDLPPALTVVSMTVSGALFGALGVMLGTPLAAAGLILVRKLYVEDTLDDHMAGTGNIMQSGIHP